MGAAWAGRQGWRGGGVCGGPGAASQAPHNDAKAEPPGKFEAQKRGLMSEIKGNT